MVRSLALVLLAACALAAGSLASPSGAVAGTGGDWVTFVEETATRIVAAPEVGTADIREKDIISGDVDQDGDTDLLVVRKIPFTNAGGFRNVLFMNQNGVMTDRTADLAPDFLDATDDRDVELADFDGDGWLDVVTAGTFDEQPRILMNLGLSGGVWRGFEWQPARLPTLESPSGNGPKFCGLAVGDVTGDGRPDIYMADYENDLEDVLLINDGNGFFANETSTRLTPAMVASQFGTDADMGDMNGDGFLDVIKTNSLGSGLAPRGEGGSDGGDVPAVSILYNDGTGHFTFQDFVATSAPYMSEPADFTQDSRLDLFVVDDGQDRYLTNSGNDGQGRAVFQTTTVNPSPNTNFFGGNVKFADLDRDGILDVMVADVDTDAPGCSRQLVILQGQGIPPAITYSDPLAGAGRAWTPNGTHDIEALHINDDNALDLWIATCTGHRVFMGIDDSFIFAGDFETGDTSEWTASVP